VGRALVTRDVLAQLDRRRPDAALAKGRERAVHRMERRLGQLAGRRRVA
jgi:hypothetical protein